MARQGVSPYPAVASTFVEAGFGATSRRDNKSLFAWSGCFAVENSGPFMALSARALANLDKIKQSVILLSWRTR